MAKAWLPGPRAQAAQHTAARAGQAQQDAVALWIQRGRAWKRSDGREERLSAGFGPVRREIQQEVTLRRTYLTSVVFGVPVEAGGPLAHLSRALVRTLVLFSRFLDLTPSLLTPHALLSQGRVRTRAGAGRRGNRVSDRETGAMSGEGARPQPLSPLSPDIPGVGPHWS